MEDRKDIVRNQLDLITDLDDRRLLKKVIYDVYENIISYDMDMYEKLERRIYDEIDDPFDKFYIYSGIIDLAEVDPISDFFHPMLPSDIEAKEIDLSEINQSLLNNKYTKLTTVFLKCDYKTFMEITNNSQTYSGVLLTDKASYPITVSLKASSKYTTEIEKLYHVFQINSVQWNTVNCPYAYKFADVLLSTAVTFGEGESVTEISVNLGEFEQYKMINKIPVWNVKQISLQDKTFPMPAKDRINYEHTVSIAETGADNGYLITDKNVDFEYLKRYNKDLIIISPFEEQQSWNLYQIENKNHLIFGRHEFEVLSNQRTLGFAGRFASTKSLVIRTKGEIARILSSYEQSKEYEFLDVFILDKYEAWEQTRDYNSFVDDNVRIDRFKKTMLLRFALKKTNDYPIDDYLLYDKMSFLVSEIQVLFPEFHCLGEMVL